MVVSRHKATVCSVLVSLLASGCASTVHDTASNTLFSPHSDNSDLCDVSYSDGCGTPKLSLLNPMENVEYITRAELSSEHETPENHSAKPEETTEAERTLTDNEED